MGVDYSAVLFVGFAYNARDLFIKGRACKCGETKTGKFCPECGGKVEDRYMPGPLIEDDPDGGYKMKCGLDLFCEGDIQYTIKYDNDGCVFIGRKLDDYGDLPENVLTIANEVREKMSWVKEFSGLPVQVHALGDVSY